MEIHSGNQHLWRCDLCRKKVANSLCLTLRRFHSCVKCWFKLMHNPELKEKVFMVFKQRKVEKRIPEKELMQIHYPEFCNHLGGCAHRESFHVDDIPAGGDHIKKSEVWEFIIWNGHVQELGRFS